MTVIDMVFEVSMTSSQAEKTTFLVSCSPDQEGTDIETQSRPRSCKEASAKCELVDYHSLPNFLKHNEFILDYYRSEWPMKESILSLFSIHNETLNVWTHLAGFLIFLGLTMSAVLVLIPMDHVTMPARQISTGGQLNHTTTTFNMSQAPTTSPPSMANLNATNVTPQEAIQPIAYWPFYTYLIGAMFCMLMSSTCHLLSCHSEHTCYVMLRLDYAGISALIVTSFYPLVYYSFACDPFFKDLYLGFITVFGVATVLVSLAPVFETAEFRYVRSGLFTCMAVSGLVPILHKFLMFGHRPEAMLTTGYEMVMAVFYGLGVVVYVARVPERWMPGKFDLAGNSHQLFHVLVIAGAYMHYLAGTVYLHWREMEGC